MRQGQRRRGALLGVLLSALLGILLSCAVRDADAVRPTATCEELRSSAQNPLGSGSCRDAQLDWTSDVPVSSIHEDGSRVDISRLEVRAVSTTGDCVRTCGGITSTQEGVERNLDVRVEPPVYVFQTAWAGGVPEAVHTMTTSQCDINEEQATALAGSAMGNYEEDFAQLEAEADSAAARRLTATDAHTVHPASRRLRADSWVMEEAAEHELRASIRVLRRAAAVAQIRAAAAPAAVFNAGGLEAHRMQLHPAAGQADRQHGGVNPEELAEALEAQYQQPGEALAMMMHTHDGRRNEVLRRMQEKEERQLLRQLPALEQDVWEAAGEFSASPLPRVLYAIAAQRSKNAAGRRLLALPTGTVHWSEAERATHGLVSGATMEDVVYGHDPASTARLDRKLLFLGAVALGVAAAALAVGVVAQRQAAANADKLNNEVIPRLNEMEDRFTALEKDKKAQLADMEAQKALMRATQNTLTTMSGSLDSLRDQNKATLTRVAQNEDALQQVQADAIAAAERTNARLAQQGRDISEVNANLAAVTHAVDANLAAMQDQLSESVQGLAGVMVENDGALRDWAEETVQTLRDSIGLLQANIEQQETGFRDLALLMLKMKERRSTRRGLATLFHALRRQIEAYSWRPFLDVSTLTSEVLPDPASWWMPGSPRRRLEVDTLRLLATEDDSGVGAGPWTAVERAYVVVCDAEQVLDDVLPWDDWTAAKRSLGPEVAPGEPLCAPLVPGTTSLEDFLQDYGETGSLTWNAAGARPCTCWVEVSERACPAGWIDSTSDPMLLQTNSDTTVPGTPSLTKAGFAALCGASPVTERVAASTPVLLRSATELDASWRDSCADPALRDMSDIALSAQSPEAAAALGVSAGLAHLYLQSDRLTASISDDAAFVYLLGVPWPNVAPFANATSPLREACSQDSGAVALQARLGLASAADSMMKEAWRQAAKELRHADAARTGSLTGDVRIDESPFNYEPSTATNYGCTYMSFLAIQGGLAPVRTLRPVGIQKRAAWYMAPVAPSEAGATDGLPAVAGTSTSFDIQNDMSFQLPADSIMVGSLRCAVLGCQQPRIGAFANVTAPGSQRFLYDIPAQLLSLDANPVARAGGVLYTRAAGASPAAVADGSASATFSLTTWRAENPNTRFDPIDGGVSIESYRVELTAAAPELSLGPGDVRCATVPSLAQGPMCSLLETHYFYVPSLDGRDAALANTPAAACADVDSGALCLAPRASSATLLMEIPAGTIAQTTGSICPMVDASLLEQAGLHSVRVQNPSMTTPTTFKYAWYFGGPDHENDGSLMAGPDATFGTEDDLYSAACRSNVDQDGGTLDPGNPGVIPFVSQCSNWTLALSVRSPSTGLWEECRRLPVRINVRDPADPGATTQFHLTVHTNADEVEQDLRTTTSTLAAQLAETQLKFKVLEATLGAPPTVVSATDIVAATNLTGSVPSLSGLADVIGASGDAMVQRNAEAEAEADEAIDAMQQAHTLFGAAVEAARVISAELQAEVDQRFAEKDAALLVFLNASAARMLTLEANMNTTRAFLAVLASQDRSYIEPVEIIPGPFDDFSLPGLPDIGFPGVVGISMLLIVLALCVCACCAWKYREKLIGGAISMHPAGRTFMMAQEGMSMMQQARAVQPGAAISIHDPRTGRQILSTQRNAGVVGLMKRTVTSATGVPAAEGAPHTLLTLKDFCAPVPVSVEVEHGSGSDTDDHPDVSPLLKRLRNLTIAPAPSRS